MVIIILFTPSCQRCPGTGDSVSYSLGEIIRGCEVRGKDLPKVSDRVGLHGLEGVGVCRVGAGGMVHHVQMPLSFTLG